MNRIGLDFICVLGMDPVEYCKVAAKLGCAYIGMAPKPVVTAGDLFAPWTLRDNPQLVRDVKAAVADLGLTILVGEGCFISAGNDVDIYAGDLDILAEVGTKRITACAFEPDQQRAFDQLAKLTEMATQRGMGAQIEFVPTLTIGDLPTALAAAAHVGRPDDFGVVIDTMHLFRSGSTAADVAAMDPRLIAHVQLCDVPWNVAPEGHGIEAGSERLCPGEGELPLASLIPVLPEDKPIALEIPMKKRALAGESAEARLGPCVEATRAMLAQVATQGA